MATGRKHWFKVPDSILYEGWTDHQLAVVVRLQAFLNTRWHRNGLSPEQACQADLSMQAARVITGKFRHRDVIQSLMNLQSIISVSVSPRGDSISISWPKFAEVQGLATRKLPSPTPSPAPAPKEERKDPDLSSYELSKSGSGEESIDSLVSKFTMPGTRRPRGAQYQQGPMLSVRR